MFPKVKNRMKQSSGIRTRIWNAISIVFMPPLFSFYAFLALSFSTGSSWFYLILSVIFASMIQGISLLLYGRLPKKDVNVEERKDRPALFAIAVSSYLFGFVALRFFGAPFIFIGLMFAYVCNTALAAVITKYLTKVSIHTWGIAGPSVAILYGFGAVSFVLVLVVSLIVGSTRIKLGYHTWPQVALSFLVAVPFTWLINSTTCGSDNLQILAESKFQIKYSPESALHQN